MKYLLAVILSYITLSLSAQTYKWEYEYTRKEFINKRVITNTATLYTNSKKPEKLYIIDFAKSSNSNTQVTTDTFVIPTKASQYILYSSDDKTDYIKDFIQNQYYNLTDLPIFKWIFDSETKTKNNITLYKATSTFRGRNYTIWYQKSTTQQAAPWKFSGIPGIVYEAYDDKNDFSWTLIKSEKTDKKLTNPFPKETVFLPYDKYPKLRYGFSKEMEEALSKNPNRTIFEQPRVDLETKFDNEKN